MEGVDIKVGPSESATGLRVIQIAVNGKVFRDRVAVDCYPKVKECLQNASNVLGIEDTEGFIQAVYQQLLVEAEKVDKTAAALAAEAATDDGGGLPLTFKPIEPWPEPVDLGQALDEVAEFVCKFVVMPREAVWAIALWTAFTHCFDAFNVCPLLAITSPTKGCGKTRLLTVVSFLVPRPLPVSNVTPASVFRVIAEKRPVLLCDELDTFLQEYEELRGIFNSGHTKRFAFVLRTVGDDHEPRVFSTWTPKVVARIGHFPPTISDRSIVIRLDKKLLSETVAPWGAEAEREAEILCRRLARAIADVEGKLRTVEIALPTDLPDRMRDNWEPLMTIAEVAGPPWPDRVGSTIAALFQREVGPTEVGIQLLADIATVIKPGEVFLQSSVLHSRLLELEDARWATFSRGRPITKQKLAALLAEFGVKPQKEPGGARGYNIARLKDAIARYVPAPTLQVAQVAQENVSDDFTRTYDGRPEKGHIAQGRPSRPNSILPSTPPLSDEADKPTEHWSAGEIAIGHRSPLGEEIDKPTESDAEDIFYLGE
ncbi:MAG: DUF3631 domain-containing protein [Thermoguttaceae bacterium]|nr:DUF3631 domain-containing protein [Thermoguttaceae bacterium]MDW8080240.1 DUF3631 domain-containing protein [Thermoguttaceae bacterium]